MLVKDIMKEAIAVDRDMSLRQVAQIMSEKGTGSVFYLRGKNVAGTINHRDLISNFGKNLKVSQIANKNFVWVSPLSGLKRAGMTMRKNQLESLPVIKNGQLVGMLSLIDLMNALNKQGEQFVFE